MSYWNQQCYQAIGLLCKIVTNWHIVHDIRVRFSVKSSIVKVLFATTTSSILVHPRVVIILIVGGGMVASIDLPLCKISKGVANNHVDCYDDQIDMISQYNITYISWNQDT